MASVESVVSLSPWSLIALAVIVAAIAVAYSGRFLAVGSLVIANIVVEILRAFGPAVAVCGADRHVCDPGVDAVGDVVAFVPVIMQDLGLHGDLVASFAPISALHLVTHMFVHAGFFHLLGNLIVLLAFALPFEERVGHRPFVTMYLVSGLAAAFAQFATAWGDPILMVGASGAVFGIIGAFAGSYPNLVLPLPLFLGFFMIFVRMRVLTAALVFGAVQVGLQAVTGGQSATAYMAHIGGLVAGVVLGVGYVRRHGWKAVETTPTRLDLDALEPFAVNDDARRALAQMRANHDEPTVFEVWLERFLLVARSPYTGAGLALRKGELVSSRGERFDVTKKA